MNTKRQTIWLVSMLSLMVVLSAYYLFTDNVNELDVASENDEFESAVMDAIEVEEHTDLSNLDELLAGADQTQASSEADSGTGTSATDGSAATSNDQALSTERNDEILRKVQAGAQSGDEILASIDMKRTQALQQETEKLMQIALDPKKSTDEIAAAEAQLRVIEETQAKVSDLEDQFMREYENVIITEELGRWNVIVQTTALDRSEVVIIIDKMIEELNLSPSKVAVEFVS